LTHRPRSVVVGALLLCRTLSRLAYSPSQPDGRLCYQPSTAPLTDWVSMSAVLVRGPTVTQNTAFLP